MGNQGYIYLVMFGSKGWLNFGTNPHLCCGLDCVCKVCWQALKLFFFFFGSSQNTPAIPAAWHNFPFCLTLVIVLLLWSASIFFPFAANSHHRLAGVCDSEPKSETVSLLKTNIVKKKKKNDPKIGLCCRVFSRRVTIWVHMAVLVQRTICHQAVIFIWVWLFQLRPYVAEFHYTAQKYVFIPLELKVLMQPSRDSMFIGNTTIPNTTAPLYCF